MRPPAGLLALLAAAALAQGQSPEGRSPRGKADAGPTRPRPPGPVLLGTDPPGRLRAFGSSDGGVIAPSDAGADDLRREVQQLRARIFALEQDRGQLQQQSQQLGEV